MKRANIILVVAGVLAACGGAPTRLPDPPADAAIATAPPVAAVTDTLVPVATAVSTATAVAVVAAATALPDTPTPEALVSSPEIGAVPTTAFNQAGLLLDRSRAFVPLDNPVTIAAGQATWLLPDEIVMGVEWNGEARAYPVSQMAYHHVANDTVGGAPLLLTY